MSGTPIVNTATDAYSLFNFIRYRQGYSIHIVSYAAPGLTVFVCYVRHIVNLQKSPIWDTVLDRPFCNIKFFNQKITRRINKGRHATVSMLNPHLNCIKITPWPRPGAVQFAFCIIDRQVSDWQPSSPRC